MNFLNTHNSSQTNTTTERTSSNQLQANSKLRQSSKSGHQGGWMSKYLNNGAEFTRMYGEGLQADSATAVLPRASYQGQWN